MRHLSTSRKAEVYYFRPTTITSTDYMAKNMPPLYLTLALVVLPFLVLRLKRGRAITQADTTESRQPSSAPTSKTVLIVGGSYAGIGLAQKLLKQKDLSRVLAKVIIINPTDQFYFNVASPRVIAKPDFFDRESYIFSIPELFATFRQRFELVVGTATGIDVKERSVTVVVGTQMQQQQQSFHYDYLVLASGATTPSTLGSDSLLVPFKAGDDRFVSHIQKAQAALKEAQTVVIGGGGPVGVEFAGELAEEFAADGKQSAKVIIVSATERLLSGLKPSAQTAAEKILRSKGVEIIPGMKVLHATGDHTTTAATTTSSAGNWTVTLSNRETLTADAYVSATGIIPNNKFIPPPLLNENGFVTVDDQFRVLTETATATERTPVHGVYALGDITHLPYRVVSRMHGQVQSVVTNLKEDILGGGRKRAKGYDPEKQMFALVVPIGRGQGTGQIGGFVVFSFLVALVKGRDFFTSRAKSILEV